MATQTIELEDTGRRVDRSKAALRTTTLNHFKKYLEFTHSEFQSLDEIPEYLIKVELLGKFSTFLKDHVESVKYYTTHKNYLSSLHQAIVEIYPVKKNEFDNYYRKICSAVCSQYSSRFASTASVSTSLTNQN